MWGVFTSGAATVCNVRCRGAFLRHVKAQQVEACWKARTKEQWCHTLAHTYTHRHTHAHNTHPQAESQMHTAVFIHALSNCLGILPWLNAWVEQKVPDELASPALAHIFSWLSEVCQHGHAPRLCDACADTFMGRDGNETNNM